jgi:RimJ/RimL family protein N-acetyltransferase
MSNVVLRPWRREDAQQLASIANNKNVWNAVRDSFPSPYTVMDAMQWIEKERAANPLVNFAIVCNGQIAGSMGIILSDDVYRTSVEVGYFIGEPFWGKGIATQALQQLLQYIPAQFNVVRIVARVYEYNKASMKVLQKCGFYLEGIQRKAAIKNKQLVDVYLWVKLL